MLRTFIFNDSNSQWIEEEHHLLSHDVCAILDEEKEIIYLWNGPKSNKTKLRKAYKQIKELVLMFPELNIQFVMAQRNFPIEIKKKLDSFLEPQIMDKRKILKFSRFTTIRIYLISIIFAVLLPILSFLNLSSSLFWPLNNGNYQVNSTIYNNWLNISKTLTFITIILFSINIIIGIIENEHQVIIFSLNGLIISVGLILYLNQGIFLFLFQDGWTITNYLIFQKDIFIFLFLILTVILIFEIPNFYKLISFVKTYHKFIF
ncbi:MAG: hypothetical protein JSV62_05835 [Promethearchaeota archaeon]|nr:MAG: hypothetical protein JSV62_05835 [Candidatus Lokiarchaeota archaeon]